LRYAHLRSHKPWRSPTQLIGYWLFGLLHREEAWLYVSTAVTGAVGLLLGHSLQRLMSQRHFAGAMTVRTGGGGQILILSTNAAEAVSLATD
jgi:hypothetical protein